MSEAGDFRKRHLLVVGPAHQVGYRGHGGLAVCVGLGESGACFFELLPYVRHVNRFTPDGTKCQGVYSRSFGGSARLRWPLAYNMANMAEEAGFEPAVELTFHDRFQGVPYRALIWSP